MPPPPTYSNYTTFRPVWQEFLYKEVVTIGKMGRPTDNPRTEKIGFRMSKKEVDDIQKCADTMQTQRVNAVVEGIQLLKDKLGIVDE